MIIILSALFIILFGFIFIDRGKKDRQVVSTLLNLPKDLSGKIDPSSRTAYWEGERIKVPDQIFDIKEEKVLGVVPKEERWVEVDLSDQKLTAWENGSVFLQTPVSTGLPWWPTPKGEFHIWLKVRATRMEGGEGRYYYNLPNVPYVMFFENADVPGSRGYGLHGTYWHNDFGTVHSHGCVNLPTDIAKELYYWKYPLITNNKSSVYADEDNPGTKIVIHE